MSWRFITGSLAGVHACWRCHPDMKVPGLFHVRQSILGGSHACGALLLAIETLAPSFPVDTASLRLVGRFRVQIIGRSDSQNFKRSTPRSSPSGLR